MSMADVFATAELCEPCPKARHQRQEAAIGQHELRLARVLAIVAPIVAPTVAFHSKLLQARHFSSVCFLLLSALLSSFFIILHSSTCF